MGLSSARTRALSMAGALVGMALCAAPARAEPLATGELRIAGMRLAVSPAVQTVPRGQATGLEAHVVDAVRGERMTLPGPEGLVVKARLRGPGLDPAVLLQAPLGELIRVPPLPFAGTYRIEDVRLETAAGDAIALGDPATAAITSIDQVVVSSVSTRPLSLEEIRQRGIAIGDDSFAAFEFAVGIATQSEQVPIRFDVAFPKDRSLETGESGIRLPLVLPELEVPNLEIQGFLLDVPIDLGEAVQIPPIPAVLVIPGNVAFLDQFFQVIVLLANVAPAGSQLIIRSAAAELHVPPGPDLVPGTADDPLALASAGEQAGGGGGPVGVRNKNSGSDFFGPGEEAQGEFVVEGRAEGTHRIEVSIEAELLGLPVGPVPLFGKAVGAVEVRNPRFALTFHHPDVVRAGEQYSLWVTVQNTGEADANLVTLALDPGAMRGAVLVGDSDPSTPLGTVTVPVIGRGDVALAAFDLIAARSGRVTAAGFAGSGGASAAFALHTGVGDGEIPLSPDTLVLPPDAHWVPERVVQAALRVLGLAHSAATAPAGWAGLGAGLPRQLVEARALDLAGAGLRIRLGAESSAAMTELLLDWLGNGQSGRNGGDAFDAIVRRTLAGREFEAAIAECVHAAGAPSALALQRHLAAIAQHRGPLLSVAVEGLAEIGLQDGEGRRTEGCASENPARCPLEAQLREIPSAVVLGSGDGQLAIVGSPSAGIPAVRLEGRGGMAAVAALYPGPDGVLREAAFDALALEAGEQAELLLPAAGSPDLEAPVLVLRGGPRAGTRLEPNTIARFDGADGPRIVGVRQVPEADPLRRGRVAGVLFDRPVDVASAKEPGQFALAYAGGEPAHNPAKRWQLVAGGRVLLVNFFSSISRFFSYELVVAGIRDTAGRPLRGGDGNAGGGESSGPWRVVPDFSAPTGGMVQGFVRSGTGEPLAFAPVELLERFEDDLTGLDVEIATGETMTDASGFYRFDFVGQSDFGPFRVRATDPATGRRVERPAAVGREGERLQIDLALLGVGEVRGTVMDATAGTPVANARVTVTSVLEERAIELRTDASGNFFAADVPVGNFLVAAQSVDERTGISRAGAGAARLPAAGSRTDVLVPLYVDTGAVAGVVYEAGAVRPVGPGVLVAALNESAGFAAQARTSGNGFFRFPAVPEGLTAVRALRDETGEQATVNVSVTRSATAAANLILPGTAPVTGQVVHADGSPAARARVVGGVSLVEADAEGRFRIERVGVGRQRLRAADPATGAEGSVEIDVAVPAVPVQAAIVLAGRASIEGVLRDAQGMPLSDAAVFLWTRGGFLRAVTDSSGRYRFAGLPLGEDYVLRAVSDGGDGVEQRVRLQVPGEAVVEELRLPGLGTVTGVVLDSDGVSPRVAEVVVRYRGFDEFGRPTDIEETATSGEPVGASENGCGAACSDCAGRFRLVVPGGVPYRVEATSPFSADSAAATGRIRDPSHAEEHCLILGRSSRIRGTVYLPGGTAARAGIEVVYRRAVEESTAAERTASTDETGGFAFDLLPPGPFVLTARDPATGNRGIARGSAPVGDEVAVDLSILGRGRVRVHVVDGMGRPAPQARVELASGSPVAHLFPLFSPRDADSDGMAIFDGVPEGEFSVVAADAVSPAGGRAGGAIVEDLSAAEALVVLTAAGSVRGSVVDAQGQLVPFAQLRLLQDGRPAAFQTADAGGSYAFEFVPLGDFRLEAFDPRTGRAGVATGRVGFAGEEVGTAMHLLPLGVVRGQVRNAAGEAASAARVSLESALLVRAEGLQRDGSVFGLGALVTSADAAGRFVVPGVPLGEFVVRAVDADSKAEGRAAGEVRAEGDAVDVDVVLAGTGRVVGQVRAAGSSVPISFASLVLESGGRRLLGQANAEGQYEWNGVPLGPFFLCAHAPGGRDGACAAGALEEHGDEARVDLLLAGTADVRGVVLDALGAPLLEPVALRLARQIPDADPRDPFAEASFDAFSDAVTGQFAFSGVPVGPFAILAETHAGLVGNTVGEVERAGADVQGLRVVMEPAGSVRGLVVGSDGARPAASAVVEIAGTSERTGAPFRRYFRTGQDGAFAFDGLPVGPFRIAVSEVGGRGVAAAEGALPAAGEVTDVGTLVLDDRALAVEAVDPSDGAAGVDLGAAVAVRFTAPVDPATVNADALILRSGEAVIAGVASLDGTRRELRFAPSDLLPEFRRIGVELSESIADRFGRHIQGRLRFAFQTRDARPPRVRAVRRGARGWLVEWSEPLIPASGTAEVRDLEMNAAEPATIEMAPDGHVLYVTPEQESEMERAVELRLRGWRDLAGNEQEGTEVRRVAAADTEAPALVLVADVPRGYAVAGQAVTVTAVPSARDDDVRLVEFFGDGMRVSSDSLLPFTHTFRAAASAVIGAVATDFAGNRGELVTLAIPVRENEPPEVELLEPSEGAEVGSGTALHVRAAVSDDLGLRDAEVRLRGARLGLAARELFAPETRRAIASFRLAIPSGAQPDDAVQIEVAARDASGLLGTSETRTIRLRDSEPPAVQITSLAPSLAVDPGTTLPVAVQSSDPVGVASVRLRAEGEVAYEEQRAVVPVSPTALLMFSLPVPNEAVPGSSVALVAEAFDAAGNKGVAPRVVLSVRDATPPAVTLLAPALGAEALGGESVLAVAAARDSGGIREVQFFLDGKQVASDRSGGDEGEYVAALLMPRERASAEVGARAIDRQDNASEMATVLVSLRSNEPPVADAGEDRTVLVGVPARVSGAASRDPEGRSLAYRWRVVEKPEGSMPTFTGWYVAEATFVADRAGRYALGLTVSDGIDSSPEDVVWLTAVAPNPTSTPTATLRSTVTATGAPTASPTATPSVTPTQDVGCGGQYAASVLRVPHLIAYWRLDDLETGTATDSGPHGLHGSVEGPLSAQAGAIATDSTSTSMSWRAEGDGIRIASSPLLDAAYDAEGYTGFAVEVWVYPEEWRDWDTVVSKASDGFNGGWGLGHTTADRDGPAGVRFWINHWDDCGKAIAEVPVGEWSHLVATWDGYNQLRIYRNGSLAASALYSCGSVRGNVRELWIGRGTGATCTGAEACTFRGRIDEVAIYDHALAENRVAEHYARATLCPAPLPSLPPPPACSSVAGLILAAAPSAYYRFGEPSGALFARDEVSGSDGAYGNGALLRLGERGALAGDSDGAVSSTGGYVDLGNSAGVDLQEEAATVEAWVKYAHASLNMPFVGRWDTTGSYLLGLSNNAPGHLMCAARAGGVRLLVTSSARFNDAEWHFVACRYDGRPSGSGLQMFIDGVLAATDPRATGPLDRVAARTRVFCYSDGARCPDSRSRMWVDELAFYRRALSEQEIRDHYAAGAAGCRAP